jgi:hypothetical protein
MQPESVYAQVLAAPLVTRNYAVSICRYAKARESAAAYVITQFGLSCFRPVPGQPGALEATTFNGRP